MAEFEIIAGDDLIKAYQSHAIYDLRIQKTFYFRIFTRFEIRFQTKLFDFVTLGGHLSHSVERN